MRRSFHSTVGLALALVVAVSAVTGALLSIRPVADRFAGLSPTLSDLSVAALAGVVADTYPTVESIRRSASGEIVVSFLADGAPRDVAFDPGTGAEAQPREPGLVYLWLIDLHRSFASGDAPLGRAASGLAALGALVLAVSGALLLSGRMGGLRHVSAAVRGTSAQRWHVLTGRATLAGLLFGAGTGLYLSVAFFGAVPSSTGAVAEFPADLSGGDPVAVAELGALRTIPAWRLERLVFPFEGDPFEPFEISTRDGTGFVDQATGELVSWRPLDRLERLHHLVLALHSGQGFWAVALFTGLSVLPAPLLGVSGAAVWWRRRRARPRLRRNVPAESADTVILVGSEGNTTWGFAHALQDALSAAGHFVHVGAMNHISPQHLGDKRLFLLTATYGDGSAPSSAEAFLDRLAGIEGMPVRGVAVLGFGDREFNQYCRFAEEVQASVAAKGWVALHPYSTVNRQSPQEFAQWGETLGRVMGHDLRLVYIAETPRLAEFELQHRQVFGGATDSPTAILRFRSRDRRVTRRFVAGDLMGIVPPGSRMPRYYSLGSSSTDGFLEVSVRRVPGGLCSCHLHDLKPGDAVRAFVRPNPEFRLRPGKQPVILVGSGCGMGVLAGFVRANSDRRPMRLYYGTRNPSGDFLYHAEMRDWMADGRLTARILATTGQAGFDLQHRIVADGEVLGMAIRNGARVMVVGGRAMAEAVGAAFEAVLEPLGVSVSGLKAEGRYVEDIF